MNVAATKRYITNSVCQMDDCPSTVRTNTIWQTTITDSKIMPAATTPNSCEAPPTAVTHSGAGACAPKGADDLFDTQRFLDQLFAARHFFGEIFVRRLLRHGTPGVGVGF